MHPRPAAVTNEDLAWRLTRIEKAMFTENGTSRLEEIEDLLRVSKWMLRFIAWIAPLGVAAFTVYRYITGKS